MHAVPAHLSMSADAGKTPVDLHGIWLLSCVTSTAAAQVLQQVSAEVQQQVPELADVAVPVADVPKQVLVA